MILITGSSGLIGQSLTAKLRQKGLEINEYDIVINSDDDVRNYDNISNVISQVNGVVHLAAVSRVVTAEQNPAECQSTNISGLRNVIRAIGKSSNRPWIIFVSSREVYGNAAIQPVTEDTPHRPLNVYARSKSLGESMIAEAAASGIQANTCRLSNVYGSAMDHKDRVIPAFARAAAYGGQMSIEGAENTFDFTFVDDVTEGLSLMIEATCDLETLPPIHFVSGIGVTLGELALQAKSLSQRHPTIAFAPPRDFDVSCFVGCPKRAKSLLGWETTTPLLQGLDHIIKDFSRSAVA